MNCCGFAGVEATQLAKTGLGVTISDEWARADGDWVLFTAMR
jgi:hypothetical protein